MAMAEKLRALHTAMRSGDRWDFVHCDSPKCPHCGEDFDISENEAWFVYDLSQDSHELSCPACDNPFHVEVYAKFTFSTDGQEDDES
jgi:hypothetical protein